MMELDAMKVSKILLKNDELRNRVYDLEAELDQARIDHAAELDALRARLEQVEGENAKLREALQPFAIEKPIGIPSWWLPEFEKARAALGGG